jgi:hypothetical protein
MKKSLALLAVLGCFSQSSMAATTFTMANLGTVATAQTNFRALSEDFGSALSFKPASPAASLGITGFDISLEVSGTDMTKSAAAWKAVTGNTADSTLYVPKLYVAKGLPFGIDISAFYTAIPTTDIKVTGAALSYEILEGDVAIPAIALRASTTTLSGISEYSLSTKSVDISISKGFIGFSPYAGVGQVWVDSSTTNATLLGYGLQGEKFSLSKMFVGVNFNLGLPNFALDVDKTGDAQTVTAKLGLRW